AALCVDLALLLHTEAEVVLGLAADGEDAREARHPAVQVARDSPALGEHLAVREVDRGRVVQSPGRAQLVLEHGIHRLAARPGARARVATRVGEGEPRGPVVAEAGRRGGAPGPRARARVVIECA